MNCTIRVAKMICVFVFAYADRWFSHEAAQITVVALITEKYAVKCSVKVLFLFL